MLVSSLLNKLKMGSNKVTFGTLISIVIIIIGIYYRNSDRELRTRLTHVLNGLEHLETKHEIAVRPKIAVGYGACADVFIDAKYLINYSPKIGAPEHYDEINSRDELLKSFAYYFRHGAAAE